MPQNQRKAQTEYVRYIWTIIRQQKQHQADTAKITKYLEAEAKISIEEGEKLIQQCIEDGFLQVQNSAGGGSLNRPIKKPGDAILFTIPDLDNVKPNPEEHDFYCFDCHLSGDVRKCSECIRAFHPECNNTDIGSAKYAPLRSLGLSRNLVDVNFADTSRMESGRDDSLVEEEGKVEPTPDQKPVLPETQSEEKYTTKQEIPSLKDETIDIKNSEEEGVSQIRLPSRKRRNDSVSNKAEDAADDNDSLLCSACRHFKRIDLQNPPSMKAEEINYLLKFIFQRIRSWISSDTFSPLPITNSTPLPSKKDVSLFKNLCYKQDASYEKIEEKLKLNGYSKLSEFQVDILDIQHKLGILYGKNAGEYEASRYLVSDCFYELSEIRQCHDCYRHSNEKANKFWFCKPCMPCHELVYAKQTGYSYWPAKVIKVTDNQYDVRFFGAQHSRAVIDGHYVRPIDTELKVLKVKKSPGFNKAMEELRIHEDLLQMPPGRFSYEAELVNPVPIDMNQVVAAVNKRKSDANRGRPPKSARGRSPKNSSGEKNVNQKSSGTKDKKKTASSEVIAFENEDRNDHQEISASSSRMDVTSPEEVNGGLAKRKRIAASTVSQVQNETIPDETKQNQEVQAKLSEAAVANEKSQQNVEDVAEIRVENINTSKKRAARKQKLVANPQNFEEILQLEEAELNIPHEEPHSSSQEPVVTSTQEISAVKGRSNVKPVLNVRDGGAEKFSATVTLPEKRYCAIVETLGAHLATMKSQPSANKLLMDTLQDEIDRYEARLQQMREEHVKIVSEVKKNQWCVFCEKKAIYYCCWNTTYCSTDCQQNHWDAEHKNACRRRQ